LTKSETSGGSLFSKYEEGEVRLVDFMNLFDEYGKNDVKSSLQSTYEINAINAMNLTKIVEELCEMRRGENKSWFREYSISDIRQKDHSSLISSLIPSSMEAVLGRVEHKVDDVIEGVVNLQMENQS